MKENNEIAYAASIANKSAAECECECECEYDCECHNQGAAYPLFKGLNGIYKVHRRLQYWLIWLDLLKEYIT